MTPETVAKLRVWHVIDGLGTGGAERSISEMLPGLEARDVSSTIFCLRHRSEGVEAASRLGGADVRVLGPGNAPARVRRLRKLIEAERPDLIHTTLFTASLFGRLSSIGLHVPVLTSIVNTAYVRVRYRDPNLGRLKVEALRTIDGWTARRFTDHFHAITNAVKESAVESLRISPERVTVIPRGHDPARLGRRTGERRDQVRRELGLEQSDEVVVNLGRQEFQKGHRVLLDAAAILWPKRPNLKVLIAGRPGSVTGDLRTQLALLRLQERVRFLGYRDDAMDLLAAADLFVFPSLFEGLGNAVLEAMGLGLPVVASDLPALREVVEDGANAHLVPPENPGALAAAIDGLLSDSARLDRFGRRSGEIFLDRFTLDSVVDRMAALYRRLCLSNVRADFPDGLRPNLYGSGHE